MAMNPGGVGALAQVAAEAALDDHEHIERSVRHVAAERLRAYRFLDALRMPYIRSDANFIMACAGPDTPRLVSSLRESNVLVTSGEYFGYPEWFRFSLQKSPDTDRFFDLLRAFRSDMYQRFAGGGLR
jgi:histidinol-phosphate aminotransferase